NVAKELGYRGGELAFEVVLARANQLRDQANAAVAPCGRRAAPRRDRFDVGEGGRRCGVKLHECVSSVASLQLPKPPSDRPPPGEGAPAYGNPRTSPRRRGEATFGRSSPRARPPLERRFANENVDFAAPFSSEGSTAACARGVERPCGSTVRP